MAGSIPFLTLGLSERDIRRLREHPSDSQTVRRLGPVSAVKISYVSTFKLTKISYQVSPLIRQENKLNVPSHLQVALNANLPTHNKYLFDPRRWQLSVQGHLLYSHGLRL
ncbi:hypothetical protein C362_05202, partial [Cryptococcus neoformans Bt1]